MITGKYPGNGTSQPIAGLGFQPMVVIVKADAAEYAVWRSDKMIGDSTAYFVNTAVNFTGGVTSLDADGFSVGANSTVNSSGVTYYYTAFGDGGAGDIFTGSYTGDGVDDRNIIGIGFQPVLIWVKGNVAGSGRWRSSSHVGDSSSRFSSVGDDVNFIQNFQADGFQIGTDFSVNSGAGSPTYYYVAFKANPSQLSMGDYTGNGVDDRNITGVGFRPDYLWVKSSSTADGLRHRSDKISGDLTLLMCSVTCESQTNNIQTLSLDAFQLGSDPSINLNTVVYHYVAWKHQNVIPVAPASLGPTGLVNGSVIASTTPTFQFTLADSDSLDTVKYRIQIDDTADFSSPVVDYTSALSAQGTVSFTVGQAVGGGSYTNGSAGQVLGAASYYWRVLTIDDSSISSAYTTANSGLVAFVISATSVSATLPNTGSGFSFYIIIYFSLALIVLGFLLKTYARSSYKNLVKLILVTEIREFLDKKRLGNKNKEFDK